MQTMTYGEVNPHIIGVVMKEAVRRAIKAIRSQRFVFEATAKVGYSGNLDDLVTSADLEAQAIYLRMFSECFPLFGIVAEEKGLRIECRLPGLNIYFTVDPLDGTKAYGRRQSHGIGTMVSLVCEDEVIAAFVGDVMTEEIYGYRPGSTKVHRISEFDHSEDLTALERRPLREQYVLLRAELEKHSDFMRPILHPGEVFKSIEITGGSIGMSMARLWKGEVGAAVLRPGPNHPWDICPVLGITRKLGFAFLKPVLASRFVEFELPVSAETKSVDHDLLVVHSSNLNELAVADLLA